jgi:thioredoxin reductase
MFDVVIVGGSYAGLSAGLQLARARRKVLVIDEGLRRNRFAHASHGFLGHDGRAPGDIVADARAQLTAYPTVEWLDDRADTAEKVSDGFSVGTKNGQSFDARRMILATGVADELPSIPGLAERWGKTVFHCPFCHGYELDQREIGVLAVTEGSMHQALMLPDWGPTTFFLNDVFAPDDEQLAQLHKRGVKIEQEPIARISGALNLVLSNGRTVSLAGLFTMSKTCPSGNLAVQLGCAIESGPTFSYIRTDPFKETSVPGVFACGDAAMTFGSVALAVGDGAMSAGGAYRSLAFGGG